MIATIGKVIAGLALSMFLVIGVLTNIKDAPNIETSNKNTLAWAYMDKNKEQYAKCYNSVNSGSVVIGRVSFSYLTYNMSETDKNKLKTAEEAFKADIKARCQQQITDYETNFETYKSSTIEIANTNQSLLSKMLGNKVNTDEISFREYQPSIVAFMNGSPLSNHIFTEDEVKQYFVNEMGY